MQCPCITQGFVVHYRSGMCTQTLCELSLSLCEVSLGVVERGCLKRGCLLGSNCYKKGGKSPKNYWFGAGGRSRTDMELPPRDFESRASTNFTTPALKWNLLILRREAAKIMGEYRLVGPALSSKRGDKVGKRTIIKAGIQVGPGRLSENGKNSRSRTRWSTGPKRKEYSNRHPAEKGWATAPEGKSGRRERYTAIPT